MQHTFDFIKKFSFPLRSFYTFTLYTDRVFEILVAPRGDDDSNKNRTELFS